MTIQVLSSSLQYAKTTSSSPAEGKEAALLLMARHCVASLHSVEWVQTVEKTAVEILLTGHGYD